MWVALSLLSAFGQALGWALKKKTLENKGVNNTLAAVSSMVAGVLLFAIYGVLNHWTYPPQSDAFVRAIFEIVFLNFAASWCAYRALDIAPLSFLMPFIALSSLGLVPVEYVLRGVLPNKLQALGIFIVVGGAILFSLRRVDKVPVRAVAYFSVTVLCYAIAPAFGAVAVHECGSGLLSAACFMSGVALAFIPLILHSGEWRVLRTLRQSGDLGSVLSLMALVGVVAALFENGPNSTAMQYANASEVMAVKRTMPFFALVLGMMMFKETITRRHVLATAFLVVGSAMVVWYR